MPRLRRIICHDCHAVLTKDEHAHYVYQCHRCVVVEHELVLISGRDPDHPDLERLVDGAVDLSRPKSAAAKAA
jgi:hypothetical protein